MEGVENRPLVFGEFEVDPTRRVLSKGGEPVALNRKAVDLLLALIERPGEVVTKDELLDKVWANQFVEEKNLSVHIAALRKVFGETKNENRFIATVAGTGYTFVAPLEHSPRNEFVIETETFNRISFEEEIIEEKTFEPAKRKKSYRRLFYFAIPVAIVLLGFAFLQFRRQGYGFPDNVKLVPSKLTTSGKIDSATISPDGNFFVYSLNEGTSISLWVGQTNANAPTQIRPAEAGMRYNSITFTPDGAYFYYVKEDIKKSKRELYRSLLFGGVPEKIRDSAARIAFSPDCKQISYIKNENNRSSLFVSDLNSTEEKLLFENPISLPLERRSMAWSPDGSMIAVSAPQGEGKNYELFTVTVADGAKKRITGRDWNAVRSVKWFHDMGSLVVVADERTSEGTTWQIYEVAYPNGSVRPLTGDLNSYGESISMSADGTKMLTIQGMLVANVWTAPVDDLSAAKQITFGSIGELSGWWGLDVLPDGRIIYSRLVDNERLIWIMDPDGTNQKQLVPAGGENFYPSVTSDGRSFVFQSSKSSKPQVWLSDTAGGKMKQLTFSETGEQPNVSSDGRFVVYVSKLESTGELWRINIDGSEPVKLAEKTRWPRISPDSSMIAYGDYAGSGHKLTVISIDGEPLKSFEVPGSANFRIGLQWTIDGKFITYRDWIGGVWRQDLTGGSPEKLPGLPDEKIYGYDWQPDGKSLVYTRGEAIRDAVLFSPGKNN